jgi:hypothetical protein
VPDSEFQKEMEREIENIQRETHTQGIKNFTVNCCLVKKKVKLMGEKIFHEQNKFFGVPTYYSEKSEMFESWEMPFRLDAKTSDNDPERTVSYLNKYITGIMREITNHCLERVSHVPCDEETRWKIEVLKE